MKFLAQDHLSKVSRLGNAFKKRYLKSTNMGSSCETFFTTIHVGKFGIFLFYVDLLDLNFFTHIINIKMFSH